MFRRNSVKRTFNERLKDNILVFKIRNTNNRIMITHDIYIIQMFIELMTILLHNNIYLDILLFWVGFVKNYVFFCKSWCTSNSSFHVPMYSCCKSISKIK